MKKTLIVLAFVVALFVTEKAQAQLGIHVGYMPELMKTSTPADDTTLYYHGIGIGLDWEFNLAKNLSLTAGVQYRMNLRGDSKDFWQDTCYVNHTISERQALIDIPILLNYGFPVGKDVVISPFAGPMLSWGIKGKTYEMISFPINKESHREWYGENGYMNRFNVYAMAGVKIGFKRSAISLGGRYGFLNIDKRKDTTTKAFGFFLNFGHTF